MKKFFILLIPTMLLSATIANAQKTWTGATSTAWNTAGNWSPSGVPTAAQNVTIPVTANQPLISGTTTPVCNNLTVNAGATLTISGTTTANAQLNVAGTATFNGNLSIGGSLTKTGKLIATNIVWNSTASVNGYYGGRMELSGNWTFASGSAVDMGLCFVTFNGTASSYIYNYSANSKFGSVTFGKTTTATTFIGTGSNATITFGSGVSINADNTFTGGVNINTIVKGNITANGRLNFYAGTLRLERASGTQSVQMAGTNNRVNNLLINCGETVTLNNQLEIMGDLTIQAGTLDPQNNTLYVTGDWNNEAGPEYFTQGSGKVVLQVIINKGEKGSYDQYINYSEDFSILEINNAYGDVIINSLATTVTCNQYDWTAGGIKVEAGTFTAEDLADNGIFGRYTLSGTGTINLTNDDGYVDLNGTTLNISGGNFNVYGGTTDSYWPFSQNASLTMSGGVLNFAETGIRVSASTTTLTSNITGGTIKTAKDFINYRSDFNPAGGTIEMYGTTDAVLFCVGTAALYGVKINKAASKDGESTTIAYPRIDRETGEVISDESRAQTVNLTSTIIFNGNFVLTSGTFNSSSLTIQAKRDWTNNAGAGSFNPGTGRVIFNGGNYHQYCYNETFNILEVAKTSGGSFRLNSGSVTCAQYDWTAGSIDVNTGTFTADDLYENGLYGGFYVNPGGTINLYQDAFQYVDLNGSLTFTNGGTINIYGGNGASQWALGANASVTMNAGTLDFKDQGITLTTLSPNTITENITGGTIRTAGGFFCNRTDFTPVGGVLELYGSNDVYLEQYAGILRDIKINKGLSSTVNVNSNLTVVSIEVTSGTMSNVNKIITMNGHLYVENGGIFSLGEGAQLKIASEMSVNVNSGGIFRAIGTNSNQAIITRSATNYYYFNINNGATISAKYAKFQYPANIILAPNAIIDPAFPFDYCTFSNGQGTYILLNNAQELTIRGANFPTLPPTNTVAKTINHGHITFKDATGAYAGPAYEYDPYNRIDWTVTQPGLWTGAVSTDWWTSANWDDGNVPNAVTDVTIPATVSYMPIIGAGIAYCKNITINGTLTMGAGDLNVSQNLAVNGTLAMSAAGAELVVQGDIEWNSGSAANITANAQIHAYGNWNFNAGANANLANGTVFFLGTVNKWIRSYSADCSFFNLRSQKSGGAQIGFSDSSIQDLIINGFMEVYTGSKFVSDSEMDIIIKGNLTSNGTLQCNFGIVKLDGTTQSITPNVNDYFNTLTFSQTGTATIVNTHTNILNVKGDLHIDSGIFNAGTSTINIGGDWDNNVGPAAFTEGASRVVFNGGNYHQYCITDENFNIVEINKPLGGAFRLAYGAEVFCNTYHWMAGALDVLDDASFTAPSLTNGITGNFYATDGGTITLGQYGSDPQLKGNLYIHGGTINIIAAIESQWPGNGNASITMSSGELNVYPYGIVILDNPPYTFTTNITGGKIRTEGSIENHRADFTPTAGTVEMYGPGNSNLLMYTGSLWGLTINKETTETVFLGQGATVNGPLTVESGTLKTNNATLTTNDNIAVNNGGTLWMDLNSQLKILSDHFLDVNSGGLFKAIGTEGNEVVISRNGSSNYFIYINDGGTIAANRASFYYVNPILIGSGGTIDPANPFDYCKFRYCATDMLRVLNAQELTLHNVEFLTPATGFNVSKPGNQGSLTFRDATGDFSGSAFENDPYNRIHWTYTQPGLWTGAVSTDWQTSANWDDGNVPNAVTDVTIPATAPYMPIIGAGIAYCKNITIDGVLTIATADLNVAQNLSVNGTLAMNAAGAELVVQGDIEWNSGSAANITADAQIHAYGNWNFNTGANANLANGTVFFMGSVNKWIRSYSADCSFFNLRSQKTGGAQIGFSDLSTEDLKINGYLLTFTGSTFVSDSPMDVIVKGNITSQGTLQCNFGAIKLDGVNQSITPNVNDYFNHFVFSQTGTANIVTTQTNIVNIKGDIHFDSGIFNAGSSSIKVGGNWDNNVGTSAFVEGGSRVIFNGGNYHQYCGDETFNIVEVDKPLGGALRTSNSGVGKTVLCNEYDWTAGALDARNGNFTAISLSDNGIAGNFYVNEGGSITLGNYGSNPQLKGNITITGGTFNIIAAIESQWPGNGNASITMSDGELNVYPYGIEIVDNPPYTFTTNISGGKIRTEGSFFNHRADFTPGAGVIELYGDEDAGMVLSDGSIYDLNINKTSGATISVATNITITGETDVDQGTLKVLPGKALSCRHTYVQAGGTLWVTEGATLDMFPSRELVSHGGLIKIQGTPADNAIVTCNGGDFNFAIMDGGTISASDAYFSHLSAGVNVTTDGLVDPNHAFTRCTFENGFHYLMRIDNNQDLTIQDAHFPTASAPYNAIKYLDQGSVTFINATGAFSGEDFEDDPYNRIHWIIPQPGLWTGAISSNWYTADNWDDSNIPTAGTDVVIPATAPNMPAIDAGDWYINSLTVNGSLNLAGGNLTVYENATFNGELLVTSPGSQFVVLGDFSWNSGSSAEINQDVTLVCNGNWNFNEGSSVQFNNGNVIFAGTSSKWIRSFSENSFFHHLYIQKTGGAQVGFSDLSTQSLEISGDFKIWPLAEFIADTDRDILLHGDFISNGTFKGNAGKLVFSSVNQTITPNTGDYFNSLKFNQSGTVSVNTTHTSNLVVNENLQISSGIFAPGNVTIYLAGDWSNPAGPDAFNESNTTVVFNGANSVQRIYNDENFMTLVIEKAGSGSLIELSSLSDIFCYYYNWNEGGLSVVNGSFTAHSLIGGVIGGDVSVQTEGTITIGNLSEQVNLVGRLFILGGTFNIINGIESQWPGEGHAQLTMSGGELNVYPYGIEIVNSTEYLFINQITGGKIRTTGSFVNHRTDFAPEAGTIEMYGEGDVFLSLDTPSIGILHNLIIDKQTSGSKGGSVTLNGSLLLNGGLDVNEGRLNRSTGNMLVVLDYVDVHDGATLSFEPNSAFALYPSCQVSIYEGGTFESLGTESQPIAVNRWGDTGFYDFGVGGTISSRFTTFDNCGNLIVAPSGFIDPENAFYHCTFPYAVGALLIINNSQNVTLREVQFPNVPISMNVKKTLDQGRVTMLDASGPGAGSTFELDPYNRIDWRASQPGLWTGIVSSDWHNPGNWDDLSVPTYQTDVYIPEEAPHMPAVSAEANCKNITVMGEIAIFDNNLWVSNAHIYGHVNNDAGFRVYGDLYWHEGSTATFGDDGAVNILGDWYFNPGSQVHLTNGAVYFSGQAPSSIFSFSSQSAFNKLQLMKDPGIQVTLDVSSDQPLNINGDFLVMGGNGFFSNSSYDINVKGAIVNHGVFRCEAGRVVLQGADQIISPNVLDYFHTLVFNQTGVATINTYYTNILNVKKDLIIESGVFSPGNSKIKIEGEWKNNIGYSAFDEGNSRVIFTGDVPQFSSSEHFNILELDKSEEYLFLQQNNTIICEVYDWTEGGLWIAGDATFVANDLADDGIYGFIHLFDGNVELYQDATQSVDLRGDLMISGGEVKVWGGFDESVWGTNANASLTMVNGILNFNDHFIKIQDTAPYSFTSTISGGTIRTQKSFIAQSPGFNPTGGAVELYGNYNGAILTTDGSAFYDVYINKPGDFSTRATIWSSVVKNNFMVAEGLAEIGFDHELECWNSIEIEDGGWLATSSSTISMKNLSAINVYPNGQLSLYGYEGATSHIKTTVPGDHYTFSIHYGGYIEAMFTIFENLSEQGVYLSPGAIVSPYYSFTNCEFRNGTSGPSVLLSVENDQDIIIENAVFPTNTWGGQYNVRKIFDSGSVTFINATGNFAGSAFENDPYNRIFWGDEFATHPISLPAGWSGISSYVIPGQPAMEDVFAPIADELIIAQTMTEMYYPGQNINTIGNWVSHSAYKVKTNAACLLEIIGEYETILAVQLNAGWSLLPVVTPDGADPADLFMPVNGFVIAKDVAGSGVYWPQYNINTIGTLYPGKAYYVLMTAPGVVDYTGMKSSGNLTGFDPARAGLSGLDKTLSGLGYNITPTPSTHTIAILPSALKDLEVGTIIGAFDQNGNCFGVTIISENANHLTIFGDDPTTAEKDGFFEGEMIFFKNLTGFGNLSGLNPTFDQTLPQSDGLFTENGLSAITGFESSTGEGFTDFGRLVNIFPNPTDGVVNITGLQSGAKITVTDVRGQVELVSETSEAGQTYVDLTDYHAGVYFITIEINGQHIFRKIVLR
ncbi:MAG: T9SS type A sorting domain-containing protein [Bacteroidales bacterium]|nr:T9SS type A sorting domain-containing protein [Bacteroidales bacterium]